MGIWCHNVLWQLPLPIRWKGIDWTPCLRLHYYVRIEPGGRSRIFSVHRRQPQNFYPDQLRCLMTRLQWKDCWHYYVPFPLRGQHGRLSILPDEKGKQCRNNIGVIRYLLRLPDKYRICCKGNTSREHLGNVNYGHGWCLPVSLA